METMIESPVVSEIIRSGWEQGNGHTIRTKARSRGALGGVAGIAVADVMPAMTDEERALITRLLVAAPKMLDIIENLAMGWTDYDDDALATQEAHDHFRAIRRSYRDEATQLLNEIAGVA